MIANNSRQESYNACKTKAYNEEVLRLAPHRVAEPLLIGSAFHKGMALINAKTGTLEDAAQAADTEYRDRANWDSLLKEERVIAEKNILLSRNMVLAYGEHYINENYTVLQPEVSFRVALPNTKHHCWYFHNILQKLNLSRWEEFLKHNESFTQFSASWWYDTYKEMDWDYCNTLQNKPVTFPCEQPHYLVGTTDAIIQWNRMVWLQEHKTTAYDLYNDSAQSKNWIANWHLSTQASCYIYGIWKSLGVRPHGILLNVIIKPRVNAANPKFNFYREAFLRTEEHLLNYEQETIRLLDDYEYRMRTGKVWKNPHSCFNYNRRCDFHTSCTEGKIHPETFETRSPDYVNAAYYKVLGIDLPAPVEEPTHEM